MAEKEIRKGIPKAIKAFRIPFLIVLVHHGSEHGGAMSVKEERLKITMLYNAYRHFL